MSLINDALKRAKRAQEQSPAPAPPALQLRPVEPGQQRARQALGLAVPVLLGLAMLLACFSVWELSNSKAIQSAAAKTPGRAPADPPAPMAVAPATATAEQAQPMPITPSSAPAVAEIADPGVGPAAPSASASSPAAGSAAPASVAPAPALDSATSNATKLAESVLPKPAPLRLQGIVYGTRSPSAQVNGKTLFLGDWIGEFRLVRIDKTSATLVSASRTNILQLGY